MDRRDNRQRDSVAVWAIHLKSLGTRPQLIWAVGISAIILTALLLSSSFAAIRIILVFLCVPRWPASALSLLESISTERPHRKASDRSTRRSLNGQMPTGRLSVFSAGKRRAVEECFVRFSSVFLQQGLL